MGYAHEVTANAFHRPDLPGSATVSTFLVFTPRHVQCHALGYGRAGLSNHGEPTCQS